MRELTINVLICSFLHCLIVDLAIILLFRPQLKSRRWWWWWWSEKLW